VIRRSDLAVAVGVADIGLDGDRKVVAALPVVPAFPRILGRKHRRFRNGGGDREIADSLRVRQEIAESG
jgi:hypothetical protein